MFTEKKEKGVIGNQQNRITEGTAIVGDFSSKSGVRIDGSVEGTVKTIAKVVVGEKGIIKGNLECQHADIEGKVVGKLFVSEILTLKATAHIEGEVVAGKLAIEPGATFNATCVMKGNVKTMPKREDETHSDNNLTFEKPRQEQAN
jgi:cytoskeletal protein CcmA (bactofilin family)